VWMETGTFGADSDILTSRSTDQGATWSPATPLNSNAMTDSGSDYQPSVAYHGNGRWIAIWQTQDSLGNTIGTEGDILVSVSQDDGISWSAPAPLNTNAASDS